MVVAHTSTSSATAGDFGMKAKKNRRKITRKNPIPQRNEQDEEMTFDSSVADSIISLGEASSHLNESSQKEDDDELMIDADPTSLAPSASTAPTFAPVAPGADKTTLKSETRRIPIPPHRMTPLKKDWLNIFGPLTEILGLQVRMNVQRRCVEIRTSKQTKDIGAIQKGADFVKAYALGFDVNDAIALLRLDDLYLDSFEIKDVKTLHGDHLSRAIGRIAGQDGKTKFTIENTSRTRIVLADTYALICLYGSHMLTLKHLLSKIHIMGSFQNIKIARDALVSLILGSPPGKVYAGLRTVSSRMKQRAL
ncbi:hypothetical protein BDN70DRAFT_81956 [Pholiota conissans]|uniref:Pre-rRNA-processing protein PNO1 n=1 Tax=Pholiota conissans TaxID=109636 RepID=A0A9P5ZAK3_9AGAR|nr:hypothetical protein BDN70DRAFT_81956 [Pholiota conissans]